MTLLLPGTWGVSHGSGFLGDVIRYVEQAESKSARFLTGDHEAAWGGHVFVAIGQGEIVEAEWPRVTISPATKHGDAIWATGQPLTDAQRDKGVQAVRALIGTPYNVTAYGWFLARLAELPVSKDYAALAATEANAGPICSGVMVREMEAMDVDLGPLKTAAVQNPDWVSPADCLRWGLDNKWMDKAVPPW
jgi:hypothetical protein